MVVLYYIYDIGYVGGDFVPVLTKEGVKVRLR